MPGPFLSRLTGAQSDGGIMTPTEVQDKVREHDSRIKTIETWKDQDINPKNKERDDKIAKMDGWLTSVAEPILNIHDSKIDTLESRMAIVDKLNSDQNREIARVETTIAGVADERIQKWSDANFTAKVDTWWNGINIHDRADKWFNDELDIGPKLKSVLKLPGGIENYDVGELLGMFDRVGSKIEPEKTIAVGQPEVNSLMAIGRSPAAAGTGTQGAAGTGTVAVVGTGTPTGFYVGKTIRNISEIETRFTKLLQTYWMNLVGLQAAWVSDILPNVTAVKQNKTSWSEAATFKATYADMVAKISAGSFSGLDARISSIADTKVKDMAKVLGSVLSLPTEQAGFLTDMTSARSNLGGGKARDYVLNTVDFYYNNFKGFTGFSDVLNGAGAKQTILAHVDNWFDTDAIKKKLEDRGFGLLGSADYKSTLEDYFTDFWNKMDFGTRMMGLLNNRQEWLDLTKYYSKFPKIGTSFGILGNIRDTVGDIQIRLTSLATELRSRQQALKADVAQVRDDADTIKDYITETAKGKIENLFDFGKIVHVLKDTVDLLIKTADALTRTEQCFDTVVNGLNNIKDSVAGLKTNMDNKLV